MLPNSEKGAFVYKQFLWWMTLLIGPDFHTAIQKVALDTSVGITIRLPYQFSGDITPMTDHFVATSTESST